MVDQMELDAQDWALRATTCELLAFSLRYPNPGVMEVLVSGDWAGAMVEVSEAWGLSAAELACPDFAAEVEATDETSVLRALRVEATRLFVGERKPAVSPYEGVWRAEQDGVQPLLFVNPHSMAVERFCKACGLGQPEGTNEPLDHVATELELLQYLAALEAGLVLPIEGGVAPDAMPGGSAGAAYQQFWADHVEKWMPDFAAALERDATQPFYRSVAKLLAAFLK